MKNLFNTELLLRILSLTIFIPLMILPIIFSNFILLIIYLLFNSLILNELYLMRHSAEKNQILIIFSILITIIFFIFILLNITERISYIQIIEVISIIWIFDTFSFLGGKVIGGKKLLPKISKGKTISGLLVGIFATLLVSQFYFALTYNFSFNQFLYILLIILFSFVGDIIASIIKRNSFIKDSSAILPGHGGLLDRLDSFLGVFFIIGIIELTK